MAKAKTKGKYDQAPSLFEKVEPPPPQPVSIIVEQEPETPAPNLILTVEPPVSPRVEKTPPLPEAKQIAKCDPQTSVKQRDGSILSIDDEVTIDDGILTGLLKETHKEGQVFVIEKMTPWLYCESGALVIAARKDDREKKRAALQEKGSMQTGLKK